LFAKPWFPWESKMISRLFIVLVLGGGVATVASWSAGSDGFAAKTSRQISQPDQPARSDDHDGGDRARPGAAHRHSRPIVWPFVPRTIVRPKLALGPLVKSGDVWTVGLGSRISQRGLTAPSQREGIGKQNFRALDC
jgi:hypothetical protein